MDFGQIEERYRHLKQDHDSGRISTGQFLASVESLRAKDQDGNWWQIDPETGDWLWWDGSQWLKPEPEPVESIVSETAPAGEIPKKNILMQFIHPKTMFQRVVFWVIFRIVMVCIAFATAMILHTYALAWLNNGIEDIEHPVSYWINFGDFYNSSLTIFFFISVLFWSLIYSWILVGFRRAFLAFIKSPVRIVFVFKNAGTYALGAIPIGAGIAMIIGSLTGINSQANLSVGIVWIFLAMGFPGIVASLGINKVLDYIPMKGDRKANFNVYTSQLLLVSLAVGFLLGILLAMAHMAVGLTLGIIFVFGGIAIWAFNPFARMSISQVGLFLLTASIIGILYTLVDLIFSQSALAHDGGWDAFRDENPDGSFFDWYGDEATKLLIGDGYPPSAAAALGALLAPPIEGETHIDEAPEPLPEPDEAPPDEEVTGQGEPAEIVEPDEPEIEKEPEPEPQPGVEQESEKEEETDERQHLITQKLMTILPEKSDDENGEDDVNFDPLYREDE